MSRIPKILGNAIQKTECKYLRYYFSAKLKTDSFPFRFITCILQYTCIMFIVSDGGWWKKKRHNCRPLFGEKDQKKKTIINGTYTLSPHGPNNLFVRKSDKLAPTKAAHGTVLFVNDYIRRWLLLNTSFFRYNVMAEEEKKENRISHRWKKYQPEPLSSYHSGAQLRLSF